MNDTGTVNETRRGFFGITVGGTALGALAAASGALLSPSRPRAEEGGKSRLQLVKARGQLIVGTGSTNPPWHFQDASGKLVDMDIDLAHLLARNLFDDPDRVEFMLQGSDARIPSLVTDQVDIVCQWMTITGGRARQVEFTIPYYREGEGSCC